MAVYIFELERAGIDFDALKSESNFHMEAVRLVPFAIEQMAQLSAEVAWEELQKELQVAGSKSNSSEHEKKKFVESQYEAITQQMTDGKKSELVNAIIAELHELKSTT